MLHQSYVLTRWILFAVLALILGGCTISPGIADAIRVGIHEHGTGLAVCSDESEELVAVEIVRNEEVVWSAAADGGERASLDAPVSLVELARMPGYTVVGEMPQLQIGDQVSITTTGNYLAFVIDGVVEFDLVRDLDCGD